MNQDSDQNEKLSVEKAIEEAHEQHHKNINKSDPNHDSDLIHWDKQKNNVPDSIEVTIGTKNIQRLLSINTINKLEKYNYLFYIYILINLDQLIQI